MNAERTSCVTSEVTKVVAATRRGFLVVYYCGDKQVASESYNLNGVLVYCSGSIPDGVVRQYYGNGTVREVRGITRRERRSRKARTNGE